MIKVNKKRTKNAEAELQTIAKTIYSDDGTRRTVEEAKKVASSVSNPIPKVIGFVAPPCASCQELRNANAEGRNFSRVVSTQGKVRYCKCHYCGHTWKEIHDRFTQHVNQE